MKLLLPFLALIGLTAVSVGGDLDSRSTAADKAARHHRSLDYVSRLCNDLVCVQIGANGDFNIGTADGRCLLYYYPGEPSTTNIMVSVDGHRYRLDTGPACDGAAERIGWTNDDECLRVTYTLLGYLGVEVIHTPVMFGPSSGAILTQTVVTNHDNVSHAIGVFYEYDTTVDGDDAAVLYLGPHHVETETCYDAPFSYPYWEAIPVSGTLVGRGMFTGGAAVTPDHLAFGQWATFYNTCWDRACSGWPYDDSAVIYQWDEEPTAPAANRTVATYYGVGQLIVQPGELQISVSEPPLECTPDGIQPDPFQLLINVTNNGSSACETISVHVTDGSGSGGSATIVSPNPQIIPLLNPGSNAAVSFTADLAANPVGGPVDFTVHVTSANCDPNTLPFSVSVPPCIRCDFPGTEIDMGDLAPCHFPTLVDNPGHTLSGIAWLGECVTGEESPADLNHDSCDDGVVFVGLPWLRCRNETVHVTITAGSEYARYAACGGLLYLNAWKDGTVDGSFDDEVECPLYGVVSEWVIQDRVVTPGTDLFTFVDPGGPWPWRFDLIMRIRLTAVPVGRHGYGFADLHSCSPGGHGTHPHDLLGEVEDYLIPEGQLSVELTSFTATVREREIVLVWITASETDNDRFEVMRDGVTIAAIPSQGNGAAGHSYQYVDGDVAAGQTYSYTLVSVDMHGRREELGTRTLTFSSPSAHVVEYTLEQNYPNPFNPATTIAFELVASGFVSLKVFNLSGQHVATLMNTALPGGRHAVIFDGNGLPSGVYLCRLDVNGFSAQRKMLLMR